jgi:hypothetical protein
MVMENRAVAFPAGLAIFEAAPGKIFRVERFR